MARLERLDGLEIEEDLDFDIVEDLDGSSEYEDRRLLSGDEDERATVTTLLGYRVLPKRALRSLLIISSTSFVSIFLFGVVSSRLSHHEDSRQYRCIDSTGLICLGAFDNFTCLEGVCAPDPCGSKLWMGLDISVAGAHNGTSTAVDVFAGVMICWSLVPYLLFIFLVAGALLLRSTTALSPLALFLMIVAINEGVLKRVIRLPRPTGSCMYGQSFGMPSGHAASSIGILTYFLLEILCDRPHLPAPAKAVVVPLLVLILAPVPAVSGAIIGAVIALSWFLVTYNAIAHQILSIQHISAFVHFLQQFGIRQTYRRRSAPIPLVLGIWRLNPRNPLPPEIKNPDFSA